MRARSVKLNTKTWFYYFGVWFDLSLQTPKCDFVGLDVIPNYGYSGDKIFSGRRRNRGLYALADGRMLNADVNGAINILRKELGDDFVKDLADKGCVFQPKQVNVLALECGLRVAEAQSIAA